MQKEQDITSKEYFISFIDVLGFQKLIDNNSDALFKIYNSLERILFYLPEIHITKKSNCYYGLYGKTADLTPDAFTLFKNNYYNFSDSIILYLEAPKDDNSKKNSNRFQAICWVTLAFITEAMIDDRKKRVYQLPLRGAISYGPVMISPNNRIHVGKPIVDAYNLSNNMNWMGGAIHPSAERFILKDQIGYDKWIVEYPVPLHEDYKTKIRYALNWPIQHPNKEDWVKGYRRPRMEDIGNNHIMKHNWEGADDKREQTMIFLKSICDAFEEADNKKSK